MSTEQPLPKDPTAAVELLATLVEKDKEENFCSYPTCYELRQAATGTGRPSAYCDNPKHTAVTNHRARQQLQKIVSGTPEAPSKRENLVPVSVVNVESLRGSVVSEMRQLGVNLERYVATLAEITDPDISVAQLQATQDRAEARIAEAQQSVSAERSLRLAAEAANVAAQKNAQAEREAAELAISAMEEAEAKTKRIEEATAQHIMEIQEERDATIEQMRIEAQRQREQIESQAKKAIDLAHTTTVTAEEEARQAEARTRDAEHEARTKIAASEQLVSEARATLERERSEVDRLRTEFADLRKQTDAERVEARTLLERERTEAHTLLERERSEVDRLRAELAAARVQAERLVQTQDQIAKKENPHQ